MTEQREIDVWHDALDEPREDRIAQVIEQRESLGWKLIERWEDGRQWWSWNQRGRTILKFERLSDARYE